MASFAEGIAQGLIQGNQMAQAESDNRRKDAMNLLALNAQADDIEFKRDERDRLKKFRTKLEGINDKYYGPKEVEEKVAIPQAMLDNTEPKYEIRKKTIQLLPGQDPANDTAFLGDMFRARVEHGDVTTDDFGKMVELRDKMDKNGITKALGNYMLSKDPKALEPITGKIGADAGSLKIITQEDKKNNQMISRVRVVVEHVIAHLKYYKAFGGIVRYRRNMSDQISNIVGGLYNFKHGY